MWSAFPANGTGEEFYRHISAPDNEIPVAVPLNTVLGRTDDAALALVGLQVYSTGLEFQLAARLRPGVDGRDLNRLLFDPGRSTGQLLLGVQLADGRRASNVPRHEPETEAPVIFHSGGGGGGNRSVHQSWWLSPLPPDGPLTFVIRCDQLGISERTVVLDGAAIRAAADDVVVLWPWSAPRDEEPPPPPPPDIPAGSWFAGA